MSRKNLIIILIVALISILTGLSIFNFQEKSILSAYDSHKKVFTSNTLNPHYVGPLFATGGAMTDINRMITNMAPEKVGSFTSNSLTLIESAPRENQVYTFKKVKAYRVTKDTSSFTIMYMKSKMNGEDYEIVFEIKDGPTYDRTITIYKDIKPKIMILWLDNSKIIQKKNNSEI